MKHIILAGGSGFLGRSLAEFLVGRNYRVTILTRSPRSTPGAVREVRWDGQTLDDWADCLEGATAVVNLTGKTVNCRYTPENRREIVESRVNSVRVIAQAIQRCSRPPGVLVQASSLAIYGDPGETVCDENAPSANGFAAETCIAWEKALKEPNVPIRTVVLRIGFVLGRQGGALQTLASLTKWGLGGRIGSGQQYISWIHHYDMNRMFLAAIDNPKIEGVFNATSPQAVTNAEFMHELRQVLRRPWCPPAPVVAVRIGAAIMGTEASIALTGRRCIPKRFLDDGFKFNFTRLSEALHEIFH